MIYINNIFKNKADEEWKVKLNLKKISFEF